MSTFLQNLPSFDKENFSDFQPDLNSEYKCLSSKNASFSISSKVYADDEQVIVNEQCNLIIQYLEKANRDQIRCVLASNGKAKKRDFSQSLNSPGAENLTDKCAKKKRLEEEQHNENDDY